MTLKTQKRIRLSEDNVDRDRLGEMPDDVLVRILSCLPIIDAVRTVLLRRFGNLWTLIHTLEFDMSGYLDNFCRWECNNKHIEWFCRFVRNVLILHQNLCIDKFHVCIDFDSCYERQMAGPDISMWSRFALCRQAKEIKISDECNNDFGTSSILPKFTSQSLVTLELDSCAYDGEFQVDLGCLKKLSLNRVSMTDENFQRFISGCPSLHELIIANPFGMKKLSLIAPNIDKWSRPMLLYFPNLQNLYLEINNGWLLDFIDVSSVHNIYIKNLNFFMNFDDEIPTINQVLVGRFQSIEVFQLSCDASKEFLDEIQNLQLLECRWRRIVLELQDFCESCLLGVYHLMNSLKHLEELVIYSTEDFKASDNLLRVELPSSYVTPQLKTITIHGYEKSWMSQLQLVKLLLKSAAALDKLVIIPMKRHLTKPEELDFVKKLSSFPKASPSARVIFA
ncbi:F-box/FBD/LRR-repeat protein At5g56420-like [Silene latifolia]|uniref:F-box/FBD/LRR-repeat protein At5g56420-like n=1 Tax=Silene latifolia TaxID=37657 RepID=UPI003D770834